MKLNMSGLVSERQIEDPHQSAAGHTGNQLGSLAAEDESSQVEEHTHHRQQDKHVDLDRRRRQRGGGGEMDKHQNRG